jgi:SAM-dependent methyltransferase
MQKPVELYGSAYGNFATQALAEVRRETYGDDFGQSSWVTADEYRRFFRLLGLNAADLVLDVGCGSGGPALFLAREVGCRVVGVDLNESGVDLGQALAVERALQDRVSFRRVDVREPLPFPDGMFDAIVCMDAICHMTGRQKLLGEWSRVLRADGRVLFTDPVVVTGLVSKDEFATRSSTGPFEFGPPGCNEHLIEAAGFHLIATEDVTENESLISLRWHDARRRRAEELRKLEGEETFEGLQRFLDVVHRLTSERRHSRFVYVAGKCDGA